MDNIKVHLREIVCELDEDGSGQSRVACSCAHSNEPAGSLNDGILFPS